MLLYRLWSLWATYMSGFPVHHTSCISSQAPALLELLVEIELPRLGWGPARHSPMGGTPALIPCARKRAFSQEHECGGHRAGPVVAVLVHRVERGRDKDRVLVGGDADTDVSPAGRMPTRILSSARRASKGARRRRCRARRARAHPPPRTGDGAFPRAARLACPAHPTRTSPRVSRGATEAYSRRRGARAPWPSRSRRRAARARGARPRRARSGRSQGGSGGAG
jgi:hypothetical protein